MDNDAGVTFMNMDHLMQSKFITMFVLCFVSFLLGMIPLKLNRILKVNVSSCVDSHALDSDKPLIISLLLCFGGGVLLFTTFQHLQPEVRENMEHLMVEGQLPDFVTKHNLHFADLVFCTGFFLVYIIEEVVHVFLNLGSHQNEVEAVLHRTMSLHKCPKHSYPAYDRSNKNGTMIPRVTLGNNSHKTDVPTSLLSVSTSRQVLLDNENINRRAQHSTVDTLAQVSTAASSTDAETESTAGSSPEISFNKSFRGLLAILALSFHEVFEGLAVGLEQNLQNVWYLFVAIATHKFVLSFCLGVELVSSKTKIPLIILYICTFAIVTPIGITFGILLLMSKDAKLPEVNLLTVTLQGIAAGTLLYVTFFEILQREKTNTKSGILQLVAILLGFGFMLCLQFLSGHEHSHHSHVHGHKHHEHLEP